MIAAQRPVVEALGGSSKFVGNLTATIPAVHTARR